MIDLTKLRPTDGTAAAICDALARATEAHTEATKVTDAAKLARDNLLLDGTPAQLAKGDAALTAARDTAERVQSIQDQLTTRLAAADEAETAAAVDAARKDCEAKRAALAMWWKEFHAPIFAQFRSGLAKLDGASEAYGEWSRLAKAAEQRFPGQQFPTPALQPGGADEWP